jgi:DUF4097 and DUF4098 domain-containing protein YvlB
MKRSLALCSGPLVALLTLLVTTLAFAETRKESTYTLPLQAGGYLSLENINGDVKIEGWKKNEVRIDAVKKGKSKDLDRIKITISVDKYDHKDWVHVATEYETFSMNSGSVDYKIKVPSSALLEEIELINGNLIIIGVTGYLSLSTVNGSVTATGMTGDVWIEAVNGNLDLSFDKMDKGQSVDLESVNGAITLKLPAKSNAHVDAETVNGNITNDFKLTVDKGQWVGSSMDGRLGSGGARISIETVNGDIGIKKR